MVLEVSIEQRRPAQVIPAVHLVVVCDKELHTLQPAAQSSQVEGSGAAGILESKPLQSGNGVFIGVIGLFKRPCKGESMVLWVKFTLTLCN